MLTGEKFDISTLSTSDRVLFDLVPAPIWLEDWSEVATFCDEMRTRGVTDLRAVLETDEALLRSVVSKIDVVDINRSAVEFVGADRSDLIGTIPGQLIAGDALDSLVDQILVVWNRKAYLRRDVSGRTMGGADIATQINWVAPVTDGVADYSQVVILMNDISHHLAAQTEMEKYVAQLELLLDISRGIAATFDTEMIFQFLVETATDITEADKSILLLFDSARKELTTVLGHNISQDEVAGYTYTEALEGLTGVVVDTRLPVVSADVSCDDRIVGSAAVRAAKCPGLSVAVVPIMYLGQVLGTIGVLKGKGSPPFTEMAVSLLRILGAHVGVALRNAELYQELRDSHDAVQAAHEELQQTQTQLLSAQKMEAIGGLAAGIAHEINTPIQFVSDNTAFIRDASVTLGRFGAEHVKILNQLADHPEFGAPVQQLRDEWKAEDCDFLLEELPDAIEETIEGAQRVAEIVKAMKEFAHPGSESKTTVDVNRVIQTTMQVSRNEWKYVADIELDLDEELPIIEGHPGPLGQSLLIMIVNAAQAMAERRNVDTEGKGTIRLNTSHDEELIEIRIADDGPGIPEEIISKIFEPFFTTKEVGKGSGQGLSIAHSVVVDKHQGEIWVENSNPGATFVIRLPIVDPQRATKDS